MSVALLDHGEMVPARGMTSSTWTCGADHIRRGRHGGAVGQQFFEQRLLAFGKGRRGVDEMRIAGAHGLDPGLEGPQSRQQLRNTEF